MPSLPRSIVCGLKIATTFIDRAGPSILAGLLVLVPLPSPPPTVLDGDVSNEDFGSKSMSPSSTKASPSTFIIPSDTDSIAALPGLISLPSKDTRRFACQGIIPNCFTYLGEHTDTTATVSIMAASFFPQRNTSSTTIL
ncbi:hypothetical protein OUZ56_012129 [Daphnia magna]|uniref:Uncharacterized protein n=1 Tax=Daphnia magna TaxID=35525 RepID=A0ABQ9Z243_9CRUS|nr:hypothetical protein OUZ56_012129 [Daphnia magna]